MQGEKKILQTSLEGDWYFGQSFNWAVDTCENMKQYTGNENCKSNDNVKELLKDFIVTAKLGNQSYSAKPYV